MLALKANISVDYLAEIEAGKKQPSLDVFKGIINALEVSADEILWDEVIASKPHVFNELTEIIKDLFPQELSLIALTVKTMAEGLKSMR